MTKIAARGVANMTTECRGLSFKGLWRDAPHSLQKDDVLTDIEVSLDYTLKS